MYKPYELQNFAIRFLHKIILTYFNDNGKDFKRAFKFCVLLNIIYCSSGRRFNSCMIYFWYRVLLKIVIIGDIFCKISISDIELINVLIAIRSLSPDIETTKITAK